MFRHPDLYEALEARRRASAQYLFDPNVVLVDVGWRIIQSEGRIDRKDLRVRVHKRIKPSGAAYESFKARTPGLDVTEKKVGYKIDVVQAPYHLHSSLGFFFPSVATPAVPVSSLAPAMGSGSILPRTGNYRPLHGGCSGIRQYGSAATLGGFVTDRATGAEMVLSNFHVLAGSVYAMPGLPAVQPSPADNGWNQSIVANYVRDAMMDSMDAAVAKLSPGVRCINDQIGLGPVTGLGIPEQDMIVTKSGRTTGVTTAQISGFEGEGVLMYYGGFPTVIRNVWQITSMNGGSISEGGDSGSWWLEKGTNRVVGLHFAGNRADQADYALAISMPKVLDALKVDLAL